MDSVVDFINAFKVSAPAAIIETFTSGCCYWFAHILATRFEGEICYLPADNHFITKIGFCYYDITGKLYPNRIGRIWTWAEYQKLEPLESERITKDCIDIVEG